MYYEEKFENGYLFFRNAPDGDWEVVPEHIAHERIKKQAAEIAKLKEALLWIASMADEGDEWDGVDRFREARSKAQEAVLPKL